jgi:riboflavin kinase / FMN adenylyltransferase
MHVATEIGSLTRGRPTVLTIGAFDGVHRGHQYLIRQVVNRARSIDAASMVLTFDPRPQVVLRPGNYQLTDGAAKERIISALGVDTLLIMPFSEETSQIPAGQFLVSILDHINLAEIWLGADFAFGHKRSGDVDFLIRAGQHSGFAVHVVARQALAGLPVSSTRARELVAAGQVEDAALLLGHYPSLRGRVVRGAGRGADLGFPTANVEPPPAQLVPGTGIYAGYLRTDDQRLSAAISVGYNVVFGGQQVVVEAYVLDFDGDLRESEVALDFVARLRGEQNFESIDDLVAQMNLDVENTRAILQHSEEPGEIMLNP